MTTSESGKVHNLLRFLGFGGVVAVIGFAVAFGRFQESVETAMHKEDGTQAELVKVDSAIVNITEEVQVHDYRINENEKRLDRIGAK